MSYFQCIFGKVVRRVVTNYLGLNYRWEDKTPHNNMMQWINSRLDRVYLPILCYWKIWNARNDKIFNDMRPNILYVRNGVFGLVLDYPIDKKLKASKVFGLAKEFSSTTCFFMGHLLKELVERVWCYLLVLHISST